VRKREERAEAPLPEAKEPDSELKPRVSTFVLPPAERIRGFDEIEACYTEEQAREEAKRCLRCDLEE